MISITSLNWNWKGHNVPPATQDMIQPTLNQQSTGIKLKHQENTSQLTYKLRKGRGRADNTMGDEQKVKPLNMTETASVLACQQIYGKRRIFPFGYMLPWH